MYHRTRPIFAILFILSGVFCPQTGFGHRDVLAELYDPETRKKLDERRQLQRTTPAMDPELALLRENRDRAVKNIFVEHLQRKKAIFGCGHALDA